MNILLVVESKHLGNTLKIAKAMSEVVPLTIVNTQKAMDQNLSDYDIVGFGSGIYIGKHDKRIIKFAENLREKEAYSFVFSTSGGADFEDNSKCLTDILTKKNNIVLGTFACKALDKFTFLKLIGGVNKGHPDDTDFKNAQEFILNIVNKYNKAVNK